MQFSMEVYLDNTRVDLEGQDHKVINTCFFLEFYRGTCQVGGSMSKLTRVKVKGRVCTCTGHPQHLLANVTYIVYFGLGFITCYCLFISTQTAADYDPQKHYIDVTSPDHPEILWRGEGDDTIIRDKTLVAVSMNVI